MLTGCHTGHVRQLPHLGAIEIRVFTEGRVNGHKITDGGGTNALQCHLGNKQNQIEFIIQHCGFLIV